jgi:hypothetical protein
MTIVSPFSRGGSLTQSINSKFTLSNSRTIPDDFGLCDKPHGDNAYFGTQLAEFAYAGIRRAGTFEWGVLAA